MQIALPLPGINPVWFGNPPGNTGAAAHLSAVLASGAWTARERGIQPEPSWANWCILLFNIETPLG